MEDGAGQREGGMICTQCGKKHERKRFCSNACKDRYHNTHNPRGFGLLYAESREDEDYETARGSIEDGWDGHKNAF